MAAFVYFIGANTSFGGWLYILMENSDVLPRVAMIFVLQPFFLGITILFLIMTWGEVVDPEYDDDDKVTKFAKRRVSKFKRKRGSWL